MTEVARRKHIAFSKSLSLNPRLLKTLAIRESESKQQLVVVHSNSRNRKGGADLRNSP
jgi:hypothetical protein